MTVNHLEFITSAYHKGSEAPSSPKPGVPCVSARSRKSWGRPRRSSALLPNKKDPSPSHSSRAFYEPMSKDPQLSADEHLECSRVRFPHFERTHHSTSHDEGSGCCLRCTRYRRLQQHKTTHVLHKHRQALAIRFLNKHPSTVTRTKVKIVSMHNLPSSEACHIDSNGC